MPVRLLSPAISASGPRTPAREGENRAKVLALGGVGMDLYVALWSQSKVARPRYRRSRGAGRVTELEADAMKGA